MAYIFVTQKFVFKCREEGEVLSCLKFSIYGQFFRVIDIAKIGEKYYVIDDDKKEIHSNDDLFSVARKYIGENYGEIKNFVECS